MADDAQAGLEAMQKALAAADITNPMVTVVADSSRINGTFSIVFEALKQLRAAHLASQSATERRFGSVIEQLKQLPGMRDDISKAAAAAAAAEGKVSAMSAEFAKIRDDQKALSMAVVELKKTVTDNHANLEKQVAELKANVSKVNGRVDASETQMKALSTSIDAAKERTDDLATLFEVDLDLVKQQQLSKGHTPDAREKRLQHVLQLPFAKALQRSIDALRQLFENSNRDVDEMKALIKTKANESALQATNLDLADLVKRVNGLTTKTDKLQSDVAERATKDEVKTHVDRLDKVKADKSELLDFLHRDALDGLRQQLKELEQRLDAMAAQFRLDMMEAMKNSKGGTSTPPRSSVTSEELTSLVARVVALEKEAVRLEDVKANKADLVDLQRQIDDLRDAFGRLGQGSASTPTVPLPAVTPESKAKIMLAPISRPNSARATIPETIRPPSPSIVYTSLPPRKQSPSGINRSATCFLFDSDGNRTLATVSAAGRSVSAVEHWNNVAAMAAANSPMAPQRGPAQASNPVPPGFVEHVMPD